jgi:hypothetical protein
MDNVQKHNICALNVRLPLAWQNKLKNLSYFLWPTTKNVGFAVITALIKKTSSFWDVMICSPLKVNRTLRRNLSPPSWGRRLSQARNSDCLPLAFMLVSSSTLKKDLICSSETSVEFRRNTRRYLPEDRSLHNYCCDNRKSISLLQALSICHGSNLVQICNTENFTASHPSLWGHSPHTTLNTPW